MGNKPVYRFWLLILGCHFFTMSEDERDWLLVAYPHIWTYEGVAWLVSEL